MRQPSPWAKSWSSDRCDRSIWISTQLRPSIRAWRNRCAAMNDGYGNPSSPHWAGAPAKRMVEASRKRVASLLSCSPEEVVFTSGGSEANNFALKGAFFARGDRPAHIITTQIEHPSILGPCEFLERQGARVTYLPVDDTGLVNPDDVRRVTPMPHSRSVRYRLESTSSGSICFPLPATSSMHPRALEP